MRETTKASDKTLKRTKSWKVSHQLKSELARLAEMGTKSRSAHAKSTYTSPKPGPEMPASMLSQAKKIRGLVSKLHESAAEGEVRPLEEEAWARILDNLPVDLMTKGVCDGYPVLAKCNPKQCGGGCDMRHTFESLDKEVHELFNKTMQKDMVETLTNHPDHVASSQLLPTGVSYSTEWEEDTPFSVRAAALQSKLCITDTGIMQMLALWGKYRATRLYDVKFILSSCETPMTIDTFVAKVHDKCEEVDEFLHTHWFPQVLEIFNTGNTEEDDDGAAKKSGAAGNEVPTEASIAKEAAEKAFAAEERAKLFRAVNSLMRIQLQGVLDQSIQDLADSFAQDIPGTTPVFSVELVLDEGAEGSSGSLRCEPTLETMQAKVGSCFDKLSATLQSFTPIDAWLAGAMSRLDNPAHAAALTKNRKFVDAALAERYKPAFEHLGSFDEYKQLIPGGEADTFIAQFCTEEKEFPDVLAEIEKYTALADATRECHGLVIFGPIHLVARPLVDGLISRGIECANTLIARLATLHKAFNAKICSDYERIRKRVLKDPEDSNDLMSLNLFMAEVKETKLNELKAQIKTSGEQMKTLLTVHNFSDEERSLNTTTLEWPVEMNPVIDDAEIMMGKAKTRGEDALHTKREKLIGEIEKNRKRIAGLAESQDMASMQLFVKETHNIQRALSGLLQTVAMINKEEVLFKWEKSNYPDVKNLILETEPFLHLFEHTLSWQKTEQHWYHGPFDGLDGDAIKDRVDEYWRETFKTRKQYSASTNMFKICDNVQKSMEAFKEHITLIQVMCNPGLRNRHWTKMSAIMGENIEPNPSTTLAKVLTLDLKPHFEALEAVSGGASKEFSLEKAMDKMEEDWAPMEFATAERGEFTILGGCDDIQAILDDHIVKTQTMAGSPFILPFKERITVWQKILVDMSDIIEGWLKMQATWMYLEPIFASPDIVAQMPAEGALFAQVDSEFKKMMAHLISNPNCLATCEYPNMADIVAESNKKLETILKGLNDYLEKKRLYFARFFFLSNDEMLEILSETKDPTRVQPHLKKCFEGIKSLVFTPELDITHMISSEKEKIELTSVISTAEARGSVEKWLLILESVMKDSVKQATARGFDDYTTMPRVDWICIQPGQVALAIGQTFWTTGMHKAIAEGGAEGVMAYYETLKKELMDVVDLVRGKIAKLVRKTCEAMITLDVHSRDVTLELANQGVKTDNDFNWLAQLRYYWTDKVGDGNYELYAKMINSTCDYAYEYLGNSFRLVVTPLTDRCYRTLIGAYALHLGGAPEGPAGTGKTETTKDLAKAIGIQCVVFNCSDGLDYIAMGKFFKGLAQSGAWSCFDEFNRIEIEVLSVIAQQLLVIKRAVDGKVKQFIFEGTLLSLNPTCNSYITMNPGYAGRSELPDNLKVLFRTVAMMVPNYAMIAEIQLYSCGYINARVCGYKITTTYKLCSELLSSQFHYDYGMRAVKAVLRAAANLKLEFPDQQEELLLLRAIQDVNIPKFLSHDLPLFDGIISDLFPGMTLPDADYKEFLWAAELNCKKLGLQLTETFTTKLIQTYEMLLVRHGFMMVGGPFSGKTMVLKILGMILTTLCEKHEEIGDNIVDGDPQYRKCQYAIINPKAITMGQLFGQFDPVSHEWTDGVVPNEYRRMSQDTSPDRHWVWFDGPVDTLWIESMNTVLDDNKKLCLMSGEIIAMSDTMSMMFENMDLSQASPATVSRCGMIYLEPQQLGWRPLVTSWLEKLPAFITEGMKETLNSLFEAFVDPTIFYIRNNCGLLMPVDDMFMVSSLMRLMSASMQDFAGEANAKVLEGWIFGIFLFSFTWSVGGAMNGHSRELFNEYFRMIYTDQIKEGDEGAAHGIKFPTPFPDEGLVYDYVFVTQGKGKWMKWIATIDTEMVVKPGQKLKDVLVPTMDTARYMYLTDLAIKNRMATLFVGPTGTGKSVYVKEKLMELDKDAYAPMFLTFSAQTSAQVTQNFVLSKLDKRRRGVFGPRPNQLAVVFVDDLNMPQVEQYGAQPPIELIRTLLDHSYWTDLIETTRMDIEDTMVLAAMGPPGGGRNPITPRMARHCNVIGMTDFSDETRERIFTSLITRAFREAGYPMELQSIGKNVVQATLHIFNLTKKTLLPTPAKSHYTFNLRDMARVVNGILLMPGDKAADKPKLIRLWAHETYRVFYDRLIDDDDRKWMFEQVSACSKEYFKSSFETIFARLAHKEGGKVGMHEMDELMFGSYVHPLDNKQPYDEMTDADAYRAVVKESLDEYNQINKTPMDLVIFTYVLEHLSKVCRMLKAEGGHGLLVGVGGSGRQSITRLAAQIMGYELFQPEITKAYGSNEWKDDIRLVLKKAGADDRKMVFLLNDTQIKDESWLEDIDSILNAGEVNNIFPMEDKIEIYEKCREPAQRAAGEDAVLGNVELYAYFVARCKDNLHLVLGMSPLGATLATRLRMFPSLVNCCTIDWFQAWPEEALKVVAQVSVEEIELEDAERKAVVTLCQHFQSSVRDLSLDYVTNAGRHVYVTPTSYLELFKAFENLLEKKRKEIMTAKSQYETGLEKIMSAESQVGGMKAELEELQPQLVVAAAENVKMTAIITKESADAAVVAAAVAKDEADANEKAGHAKQEKEECEAILADAIPALQKALKALDTLKPSDIGEVKAMKDPPAAVKLVMEAVCVMKEVKGEKVADPNGGTKKVMDYWGPAKKMLGDMKFLDGLKAYDKDNIPTKVMKVIRDTYIPNPTFQPEIIAKASKAAEGLCSWVCAMEIYDRVAKVVAPKKIALAQKMEEVAALMAVLKEKQDSLAAVKKKVADLQADLDQKTKDKEELEAKAALCERKLNAAEKLIKGLGGEKVRWAAAAKQLGADYLNVTGDILISSGVIAYLGPFTPAFREKQIAEWVEVCKKEKLPCSAGYNLSKIIGDPVAQRQWHIDGLPTDNLSIDNGTMIINSKRWPLMIDPQGQANKWVKNMEKPNKLAITKLTDSTYMRTLENSIQFGQPVLIENVLEDLDPSLEGLLLRNTFKQAGVICIKLGENVIEYSDDFRFYMTTKLPNPHYLPEVSTKVNLLNFMITVEGLEDQLLGIVVAKERPEVEEERQQLILASAANAKKLKEVEVQILETLSNSEGNILEDASAIEVLDNAKIISDEVSAKQAIAEETTKKINELRKGYAPVAQHSSVLFFVIDDLKDIDPMYQYSLEWFVALFVASIYGSNKSQNVAKRLRFLSDHFTYSLYTNVCRSLFEMHKLLFSFLLCTNLMKSRNAMDQNELMFLLTGGVGLDNPLKNPDPTWVQKSTWDELCRLTDVAGFEGIREHFETNLADWQKLYDSKVPHDYEELPEEWKEKLSGFQKLMLLRVVRPDKVVHASRAFVEDNLGQRFTQPPMFDLGTIYDDSSALSPLIFVLSPGADPMAALLKFASDKGFGGEKIETISLGQGQGPIAAKMIEKARVEGTWVVLQNCHLAVSWMNDMEKICEGLKPGTVHDTFRLWLTSYPAKEFPVSVLQNGVKMTNEPPAGIKNNMKQSYMSDPVGDPEFFNFFEETNQPEKHKQYQKMLFGLVFFHAVVQERRGFGAQGFNVPYGFNESDFVISVMQLKLFMEEYDVVPYEALQYLTGQCNYGGRVTDDWDRRTLLSILKNAYSQPTVEEPKFKFSNDPDYFVAAPDGYDSYMTFLDELPAIQAPEIFGMHDNVDITKEMMQTRILLSNVLTTQTKAGAGGGDGNDRIEEVLEGILERLPEAFDTYECTKKWPVVYNESMNTVLVQEMQRFNRLIIVIRSNLVDLKKALKGLVVMNATLEDVFVNLGVGLIPASWKKASYPSLKPLGSYYNDLLRRLTFFQLWFDEGKPGAYWLPGFYFTQAFLTGAMQNFARKHQIPIDNLAFDFEVLKRPGDKTGKGPDDGVHCYGLYLDGAMWDKKRHVLVEQESKKLFSDMADIWIKPAVAAEIKTDGTYRCPVYKTSDRRGMLSTTGHSTNFVIGVTIPTDLEEDHWVRRGLALLTQLDD